MGSQKKFFPTKIPAPPNERPRVWTYIDEQGREWAGYSTLQPSNKKTGAYDLQVRMRRVMRTVVPD